MRATKERMKNGPKDFVNTEVTTVKVSIMATYSGNAPEPEPSFPPPRPPSFQLFISAGDAAAPNNNLRVAIWVSRQNGKVQPPYHKRVHGIPPRGIARP